VHKAGIRIGEKATKGARSQKNPLTHFKGEEATMSILTYLLAGIALIVILIAVIVHILSRLDIVQEDGTADPFELGWHSATFDDHEIYIKAEPPGRKPWAQSIKWEDIIRVCLKLEPLEVSDGIYIFTSKRPESYVIPIEGNGGPELWDEIIHRGLFDAELAVEAASRLKGFYCWPDINQED
jgi:hypothetical protein